MDKRNALLAVFAALILVLAGLSVTQFDRANSLDYELSSKTATTSTFTVTSTAPCPSYTACASFTYAPPGTVQVESVQAEIYQSPSGQQDVTFVVNVENTGTSPIVVAVGTDDLRTSIANNSTVARETCNCGLGIGGGYNLGKGQNLTLADPSAGNGYYYALLKGGTLDANFTFTWASSAPPSVNVNTTVSAQFVFSNPPQG